MTRGRKLRIELPSRGKPIVSDAVSIMRRTFMKTQQLNAAIAKAETQFAKAQTNFKTAEALAASLKVKVRAAKEHFKEARRLYKQLRRSGRVALREKRVASRQFDEASALLKKLESKIGKKPAPAKKPASGH
jgi:chromosome segregation ATPase